MISPQEQLRVICDVARRHNGLRLHQDAGGMCMFPVYALSGGLDASLVAVFLRGEWPAEGSQDLMRPPVNQWRTAQWKTGASVAVRFSLGLNGADLRKLLEAGASALEALPISTGTSAQGETR